MVFREWMGRGLVGARRNRGLPRRFGVIIAAVMLAACAGTAVFAPVTAQNGVVIRDAWAGATGDAGGASIPNGAAYLTLFNGGASPARLVRIVSDTAGAVELHETRTVNGLAAMFPLRDGITIAPGATVEMKIGGTHVMLVDLKRTLVAGTMIKLTLEFDDNVRAEVGVPVRAR